MEMSIDPFQIPSHVEQDRSGGDQLPTYNDLAEQSGPNSRFGRWREWIEKRAAERYADITPEERSRRRERGWVELNNSQPDQVITIGETEAHHPVPPPLPPKSLHVQTIFSQDSAASTSSLSSCIQSLSLPSLKPLSQSLAPTHLLFNQFGSRFLPHTTSPIRCLLPLLSDRLLLIGHDEGLSVLNMFPQERTEEGASLKGPDEAQVKLIWEGEGVYQMSILEEEHVGESSPQGVVLALVGPHPSYSPSGKETESLRSLRMYSLSSLINLAKWASSQSRARPLDFRSPHNFMTQQSPRKHRHQNSVTRSLKLLIDSSASTPTPENPSSYSGILSSSPSNTPTKSSFFQPGDSSKNSSSKSLRDQSWDFIDDIPLRWATDFVPLASAGSRLVNLSVISYALQRNEMSRSSGGATLAVATKSNIFLYETPKGERAFRFVKDFYVPLPPRNITIIQQSVQETIRKPSDVIGVPARFQQGGSTHKRCDSRASLASDRSVVKLINNSSRTTYGTQNSLFVIFDKKAGWIRLADSAVGEIELYDDGVADIYQLQRQVRESLSTPASSTRTRRSFESLGQLNKGQWIPPMQIELPPHGNHATSQRVYTLTRGKHTHILPYPLPTNVSSCQPFRVIHWESVPTTVTPRVCLPAASDVEKMQPILQLIALGEDGVEVQEISLSFLSKGKEKAHMWDLVRSQADLGGDAGFLCSGGHWDRPLLGSIFPSPSSSIESSMSGVSLDPASNDRLQMEEGIYGWCRKGALDWRVVWLGGFGQGMG